MKNKLKIILVLLFIGGSTLVWGQKHKDGEKIKALKIAFLTEKLSLSSSEAESFWPLYNEYEEKRENLRKQKYHEVYQKIDGIASRTEEEAMGLLDQYLELEEKEEELDKDYFRRFAGVISARKTLLLFRAEHDFRKQLIRQYSNRQERKN